MLQLNIQFMVHRSIQFFPQKFSALQRQVAVGAVFFGEGDRAGVEVEVSLAKRLPGGHVGVAMQQNVAGLQRRQVGSVVHMAVGGVNEKNAAGFLAAGCCGIGVGGNLVNKSWIEAGEWDKITELAQAYRKAVDEA